MRLNLLPTTTHRCYECDKKQALACPILNEYSLNDNLLVFYWPKNNLSRLKTESGANESPRIILKVMWIMKTKQSAFRMCFPTHFSRISLFKFPTSVYSFEHNLPIISSLSLMMNLIQELDAEFVRARLHLCR